jgi:uncharacterized protein
MVRLKPWQWVVLAIPIAFIIIFLLVSAGTQIHAWGINWIWGVFTLLFVGWRWLLVKWTQPAVNQVEAVLAQVQEELESKAEDTVRTVGSDTTKLAEAALQEILRSPDLGRLANFLDAMPKFGCSDRSYLQSSNSISPAEYLRPPSLRADSRNGG